MTTKILLLSSSVPPALNAVAAVVGHLARQFSRDEMVLVGSSDEDAPTERWEEGWPAIQYVKDLSRAAPRARRWLRKTSFPALVRTSLRVAREHRCGAVVAVFPYEEHLLAGLLVAQRTGATFFPYLHNTYFDQRRGLERWIAARIQPSVFAAASHVFVMSDGMLEVFRQRYPELEGRVSPLYHPFSDPAPSETPPAVGVPPHFVMLGSINPSNQDAASRLFAVALAIPGSRLTIIGRNEESLTRRLGLPPDRTRLLRVSRDELLERVREGDVLLLPHGLQGRWAPIEYQTMFPTKTIEYLFSGRPILAHTPKGCFLTRFLEQHECAVVVDEPDNGALTAALERLLKDNALRHQVVRRAQHVSQRFHAPAVAAHLRRVVTAARRTRTPAHAVE